LVWINGQAEEVAQTELVPASPSIVQLPLETGLLANDGKQVRELLGAAETCFARSGYAGTSIRQIARSAGVSKSLVHYHFQSKEHLFLEVQVRIYNRLATQIAESLDEGGSLRERMLFALDAAFVELRANADLQAQAKVWAASLSNETLLLHVRRMRDGLRAELVELLEHLMGPERGSLPMSAETAVDLLWAVVTGLGLQASIDEEERIERAFLGLRALIAEALGE